jgi:taurine dioxygenase
MLQMLKREILSPAIGAVIHGIDLADPGELGRHEAELRQALLDHQVIFFRDQSAARLAMLTALARVPEWHVRSH